MKQLTLLALALLCGVAFAQVPTFDASGKPIALPKPKAQDATIAGDFYTEPSTLHSLGFEWRIQGDDNRNGRVAVRYRKVGTGDWREGMDLLRIKGEKVAAHQKGKDYICGNLYAGSILFLEPGMEYDVELSLTDPDGGDTVKQLKVATKTEPVRPEGGRLLHIYPKDHAGRKLEPTFADIPSAYEAAQPGDHIVLHAGEYGGNYKLVKKATREKPIVLRAAGDGQVLFKGGGQLFHVGGAEYVWFEGLTFRGYGFPIVTSDKPGVTGLTVRYCTFEDHNTGVFLRSRECRDAYIADNTFRGLKPNAWHRKSRENEPYKAVWIAGQGIDCCYNLILNHAKDGLSTFKGKGRTAFEEKISAVDFYNNRVQGCRDDLGEADNAQHNVRYFDNWMADTFMGLSAQPVYGGPCYFVRNVMYNITMKYAFKLNVNPAGVLIYHNTCFHGPKAEGGVNGISGNGYWNVHVFNNLFWGSRNPGYTFAPFDPEISQTDYNGYRVLEPMNVQWSSFDPKTLERKYSDLGKRGKVFTFEAIANLSGNEKHMTPITLEDFVSVPPPPGEMPDLTDPAKVDARLKPNAAAIDRGKVIPNINDGFAGKAPDLGAYELGAPLPHYGPRPRKAD